MEIDAHEPVRVALIGVAIPTAGCKALGNES